MAQTVKGLYLKSGDLSLVPRTLMIGGKNQLPEVVLLTTHVHKINRLVFFSSFSFFKESNIFSPA